MVRSRRRVLIAMRDGEVSRQVARELEREKRRQWKTWKVWRPVEGEREQQS